MWIIIILLKNYDFINLGKYLCYVCLSPLSGVVCLFSDENDGWDCSVLSRACCSRWFSRSCLRLSHNILRTRPHIMRSLRRPHYSRWSYCFWRKLRHSTAWDRALSLPWTLCCRSWMAYSRSCRSSRCLASRFSIIWIALLLVNIPPSLIDTHTVPESSTIPSEQSWADRCLNNSTSCRNDSMSYYERSVVYSTTFWTELVTCTPSKQPGPTVGYMNSLGCLWLGSHPWSSWFQKLLRLNVLTTFDNLKHYFYTRDKISRRS